MACEFFFLIKWYHKKLQGLYFFFKAMNDLWKVTDIFISMNVMTKHKNQLVNLKCPLLYWEERRKWQPHTPTKAGEKKDKNRTPTWPLPKATEKKPNLCKNGKKKNPKKTMISIK